MKPTLESSRLLFREFTIEDAPLIFELNSDPDVVKYVHEHPTTDIKTAAGIITNRILPQYRQYGYGRWAVFVKETCHFIGWCGLKYRPERKETDLGYRFSKDSWGKGYATEAAMAVLRYGFEKAGLEKITAMAHIENLASLRVLEKSGMQFVRFEEVDGCPVKVFTLSNPKKASVTNH